MKVELLKPKCISDHRGRNSINEFTNLFHTPTVRSMATYSTKNVLRGLHRSKESKTKLVGVLKGHVTDFIIDADPKSSTFGEYIKTELVADVGYVSVSPLYYHGYVVRSDEAIVHYLYDGMYEADQEDGVRYDSPLLKIDWDVKDPILSDKDLNWRLV